MTFLLYLGKVMLCSGMLLGYYWLFLRNRRFHHYNRFYLQATLLLSVLLPFIRIPVWNKAESPVSQAVYQTLEVLTVNSGEEDGMGSGPAPLTRLFTLENALYILYGAGILVLLWTLIRSLLYIKRISKKYPFERIGGLKFFATREPGTPFSFFSSIFWNNDLAFNSRDGQQIFRHELFHVQQKHSTDIILTEIVTAFFWYNPFFHLLKKELKAIHEFLADQYAISENDRYAYAELLVLQTLKVNNSLTNHFFQNHIKRRIAMITNNQGARYSYRSRLMALPVLALVFCSIALYAQRTGVTVNTVNNSGPAKKPITVMIDAGHGGVDNGALSTNGKVFEKDLALQISQKIQQLAPSYNINVVMTRTDDKLPGNTTDIKEGLKARTALAEKIKPNLYIAIHVSSTGGEPVQPDNGFEVYVSNKENDRTNQSKQLGAAVIQEISKIYQTNTAILQRSKNIWVLEQTPCPALLIECGFITSDKDLAYISNSSNQETVAKKILEGIVNYNNKPAAAVPTPATNEQPVAKASQVKKPAAPTVQMTTTHPASEQAAATTNATQPISAAETTDPMISKIAAWYCRNARYPQRALAQQAEGVVYFSIAFDNNGDIYYVQTFDQLPAGVKQFDKLSTRVISAEEVTTTEQLSAQDVQQVLQEEVQRAFRKKPKLTDSKPRSSEYFFQVTFNLEKKKPVTT